MKSFFINSFTLTLLTLLILSSCSIKNDEKILIERAAKIHSGAITIDTHLDTPIHLQRDTSFALDQMHDGQQKRSGKVDFPRMKVGGIDAVFFIVWTAQGDRTNEGYIKVKEKALSLFDVIEINVNKYPNLAELAYTTNDVNRITNEGKHAILIGMENGYPIGKDLSLVEKYYDLGTRYITLTHTKDNDICDASTDKSEDEGLTEFGAAVIEEMNRLGIMVDISHISDKSFYDIMEITEVPVIASHSSVRTICDHPRNMTDDMLKSLANNGGVIQISLVNEYVKTPPPNPQRDSAIVELRKRFSDYSKLDEKQREEFHNEISKLQKNFPQPRATIQDAVDHID
ncbi:MAG: membrane dipeptidase, partial [Bacteroidota bacterium]